MRRASFLSMCLAAVLVFILSPGASLCVAQDFPGLANPFSPVFSFPPLQGEATASLVWMNLLKGKVVSATPAVQLSRDFKDSWGMDPGALFLDAMVRLQVGALSARLNYAMRYFKGDRFKDNIAEASGVNRVAAFDYTGLRIGGDLDVYRCGRSRVGIDMDYDLYHPVFDVTTRQNNNNNWGWSELTGPSALTLGFHVVYNPSYNLYGFSVVAEGRARWTVVGSQVTDWQVSAGLKGPETVLGSVALLTGYRATTISFTDRLTALETNFQAPFRATVDVSMGGWFGEFAYYY